MKRLIASCLSAALSVSPGSTRAEDLVRAPSQHAFRRRCRSSNEPRAVRDERTLKPQRSLTAHHLQLTDRPAAPAELPPYLVLLRVGFALPAPLLERRCALTAPFHPYPAAVVNPWSLPREHLLRSKVASRAKHRVWCDARIARLARIPTSIHNDGGVRVKRCGKSAPPRQ